jgi:hypothetical protein
VPTLYSDEHKIDPYVIMGEQELTQDLRRKMVVATERGMSKVQAARLFDLSLSSVEGVGPKPKPHKAKTP